MKIYISFGQTHSHGVGRYLFNKDSIAEIECEDYEQGRKIAFVLFGDQWCNSYSREELRMEYFPRGIMAVDDLELTDETNANIERVKNFFKRSAHS